MGNRIGSHGDQDIYRLDMAYIWLGWQRLYRLRRSIHVDYGHSQKFNGWKLENMNTWKIENSLKKDVQPFSFKFSQFQVFNIFL